MNLDDVSTEELLAELGRRARGHVRGQTGPTVSADMSATVPADTDPAAARRERWRRSKADYRARRSAAMSADTADTADTHAVVVVSVEKEQQQRAADMSAMSASPVSADRIPGLEHSGPAPDPAPAAPDDLVRRRLRTGVAEILARAELDRQRSTGTEIQNVRGWLLVVTDRIQTDRADEITAAVEAALVRYPDPTPTHVAALLSRPAQGRRTVPHVPVILPDPQPAERSLAALADVRAALRREVAS